MQIKRLFVVTGLLLGLAGSAQAAPAADSILSQAMRMGMQDSDTSQANIWWACRVTWQGITTDRCTHAESPRAAEEFWRRNLQGASVTCSGPCVPASG